MTSVFFCDHLDGPSQELQHQLDLAGRFAGHQLVTDFEDLHAKISQWSRPTVVWLLMPRDGEHWQSARLAGEILRVCSTADAVVLLLTEIDVLQHHLRELTTVANLWIMAPAQHNFGDHHRPLVIWQHWIQDLQQVWQTPVIRPDLERLGAPHDPALLFDVLLGGERSYRTQLHDLVDSDGNLSDRVIMSYYGVNTHRPRFILESDCDPISWPDPMHTGMLIRYRSVQMRTACIPPVSIYQQTWFTVLAETSAHTYLNFYTEKVAKPLLAGRMFLALGGQHYLRGLRDSGFQTFGSVINESYDLEADNRTRVIMVFREMQNIARRDPRALWQQAQPMIQHNLAVAWNHDFVGLAIGQAQQQIQQHCAQSLPMGK